MKKQAYSKHEMDEFTGRLPRQTKTPLIRAKELRKMVLGNTVDFYTPIEDSCHFNGWLKLGKMVLNLEKKWTAAKR